MWTGMMVGVWVVVYLRRKRLFNHDDKHLLSQQVEGFVAAMIVTVLFLVLLVFYLTGAPPTGAAP